MVARCAPSQGLNESSSREFASAMVSPLVQETEDRFYRKIQGKQ
jgi:hypothetical protein